MTLPFALAALAVVLGIVVWLLWLVLSEPSRRPPPDYARHLGEYRTRRYGRQQ